MDVYAAQFPAHNVTEALDFTPKLKAELSEKPNDFPVLDLSCKKESLEDHQIGSYSLSPVSMERMSLSPVSTYDISSNQHQNSCLQEDEAHSYAEGRSCMETPPSESESPSKRKFTSIYTQWSKPTDMAHSSYPSMAPLNNPLSPPSMIPSFLATPEDPINRITPLPPLSPVTSGSKTESDGSKKVPRPFKAYPKDPLALTVGPSKFICDQTSETAYNEFRKRMLDSVRKTNDGTNIKMRRLNKNPNLPTSSMDDKDAAAYWERRRKNNEAAKRSRDARRAKEDEIAIRAAFLEQENMKLKFEIVALRNETARLRCMVYST